MTQQVKVDAFTCAKDALRFVGEYKTPPIPKTFEVWYRYAEGSVPELTEHLDHAVTNLGVVTPDLIASLHAQYCGTEGPEAQVGEGLASEIANIQAMVSDQRSAGEQFDGTIGQASRVLKSGDSDSSELDRVVRDLADGAQTMREQLAEMAAKLDASQKQVEGLQKELEFSKKEIMTDHLTGIGNRRFYDALIRQTVQHRSHHGDDVYLALFDLDQFKLVNDELGHQAGDALLRFLAQEFTNLRPDVTFARLGGDEFAAFSRESSRERVLDFAEDLRAHFATRKLKLQSSQREVCGIRFSVGIAKLRTSDDTDSWYGRADKFLYEAKRLGGDRAVVEKSS